jgi:hypothetical protein
MAMAGRSRSRATGMGPRSTGKRDTVKGKNAIFYAKRTAGGRFKEMDKKGRSLKADRRTKSKTRTKSGYGDRGDGAA